MGRLFLERYVQQSSHVPVHSIHNVFGCIAVRGQEVERGRQHLTTDRTQCGLAAGWMQIIVITNTHDIATS